MECSVMHPCKHAETQQTIMDGLFQDKTMYVIHVQKQKQSNEIFQKKLHEKKLSEGKCLLTSVLFQREVTEDQNSGY